LAYRAREEERMIVLTPMLLVTLACGAIAWRARHERVLTFWLVWSGAVHLIMDANYGVHARLVTTRATTTFTQLALSPASLSSWFDLRWWATTFYTQYARYDGRWATADPVVLFICYCEFVMGPACLVLAWLTQRQHPMRHAFHLMLATAQFFGTAFYFCVPVVAGSWDAVMTHDPLELIVFVFILNGIWMVVPAIIIAQSLRALSPRSITAAAPAAERAAA
jgi:hypothetical protein